MLELLEKSIVECFSINKNEIKFNDPFKGGYITRTYGNNPVPWIQIEMNRSLYLSKPWFDEMNLSINVEKIKELNSKLEESLNQFFSNF